MESVGTLPLCHADTVSQMPDHRLDTPVIEVADVSVVRDGRHILDGVSLSVRTGERWVILGPNGCGKTTLLRVMSLYLHPSHGSVLVNGAALGTFDIRSVRPRIAHMSASLAGELRPALSALDVVMAAKNGALETWWHEYSDDDRHQARRCLERMDVGQCAARPLGSLSSGEQQRVLLARALMSDPIAVLLDEPSARLDLGGREQLVRTLDSFARDNPALASVVVTHHIDEIPPTTTHCALMREGSIIVAGDIDSVLTSAMVSTCFGVDLRVETRDNGRRTAYAV